MYEQRTFLLLLASELLESNYDIFDDNVDQEGHICKHTPSTSSIRAN